MSILSKRILADGNILVLLLLVVGASLLSPYFLTFENIYNVLRAAAVIGIVAVGMNVVILGGGIDLSVGSVGALAGALAASLWVGGHGPVLFVLVPILAAVVVGLANGLLITLVGLQPFVATLVMMTVARGAGLVLTDGQPVYAAYPDAFAFLSRGAFLGLPMPAVLLFAVTLVTWYAMTWRIIGRSVYAMGANEKAAQLAGINTARVKLTTYVYSAALAGFAGLIMTSRMGSGEPGQAGAFWELDAIAAVVIGGTSLQGGRGSVWGGFIGALIIGIVGNLFNLLGVQPEWQQVAKGAIILAAVLARWLGQEGRVALGLSRRNREAAQ